MNRRCRKSLAAIFSFGLLLPACTSSGASDDAASALDALTDAPDGGSIVETFCYALSPEPTPGGTIVDGHWVLSAVYNYDNKECCCGPAAGTSWQVSLQTRGSTLIVDAQEFRANVRTSPVHTEWTLTTTPAGGYSITNTDYPAPMRVMGTYTATPTTLAFNRGFERALGFDGYPFAYAIFEFVPGD